MPMKKASKKSTGREIVREIFTPGYLERARQRATRRKSRWNLLLFIVGIIAIAAVTVLLVLLADFYLQFRGSPSLFSPETPERTQILVICGGFFVSLPISMVLANSLVWLIPPARRALDAETKAHPGTEYPTAQRHLTYAARKMIALYKKLLGQL